MFGSRTLVEHVARGIAGIAAIAGAVYLAQHGSVLAVIGAAALVIVALFAWRGCPMCWLTGLIETLRRKGSRDGA